MPAPLISDRQFTKLGTKLQPKSLIDPKQIALYYVDILNTSRIALIVFKRVIIILLQKACLGQSKKH